MGAAALALAGIMPCVALLLCWVLYLSFVSVGSPFLDFQWDALLLEAGLLAVLFAPGGVRPFGRGETPPSDLVRGLVYLLLFKLLVLSGALKLASGDASWHDGTALDYHYWTQPLPHRLSVLAAGAPPWFHRASVVAMLAIELALPWLLLVPFARRRLRQVVPAGTWLLIDRFEGPKVLYANEATPRRWSMWRGSSAPDLRRNASGPAARGPQGSGAPPHRVFRDLVS